MEKERTITLGRRKHENIARSAPERISEKKTDRKYMSVREMGDLLGLKKNGSLLAGS